MIPEFTFRAETDYLPEQAYLRRRVEQVEKAMGKIAGRQREPAILTQPMDVLDRARELTNDLYKQVRVRPMEEAVRRQQEWLVRARERQANPGGEPVMHLNRIDLDLRLLDEILAGWQARRN
jgi:hypothetical protein